MDDFELELKNDFLAEAEALLESAEQAFLKLEEDWGNSSLLDEIFRLAHNLKGTSRAVGFGDVAEFTHEMENLILQIKEGKLEVDQKVITILLECSDHIVMMITGLKEDIEARFDSVQIISKIVEILSQKNNSNEETIIDEEECIPDCISKEQEVSSSTSSEELLLDIEDVRALIEAENNLPEDTVSDSDITDNEGLKFYNENSSVPSRCC